MRSPLPLRPFLIAASLAAAIACTEGGDTAADAGDAGGMLVIAVTGDADHLVPAVYETITARQVIDQLFDRLANIGDDMNTVGDAGYRPALAERWEWASDSLSIAFHLNPRARWHDGRPVRASDVRFTHAVYVDSAVASPFVALLADIDSVQVRDSLTAVFWFARRTPQQFFDATYQMHILPEHAMRGALGNIRASDFGRAPVGSGRFRFARWVPGQTIEIVADTANYRGRAKLDRVIWTVAPEPAASINKLFVGEADFVEILRPEDQPEIRKRADLKLVPYPAMQYAAMLFNGNQPGALSRPHPLFADREMRRALTMALDRQAMVRNVFDEHGATGIGPLTRGVATADTTIAQLPFDRDRAARTLDSLGWRDANGDGVRERGGRRLEFTTIVPTSSAFRMRMAVLLQEQLAQVGAKMNVEALEFGTFRQREIARRFDATISGIGTDPLPGGVRQAWSAAATTGGGSNYSGYASPVFDAYVDSGATAMDPRDARRHFRRAYETIIADAPAVWLYELRPVAGSHARIAETGLRADGWWSNLADWTIPADRRIPRDRLGLRAVAAGAEGDTSGTSAPADTARR